MNLSRLRAALARPPLPPLLPAPDDSDWKIKIFVKCGLNIGLIHLAGYLSSCSFLPPLFDLILNFSFRSDDDWETLKSPKTLVEISYKTHFFGSQTLPNLDLGWVKVMCGEFGEVSGIIDLVINFLAAGTLFLNSYDTLSYTTD